MQTIQIQLAAAFFGSLGFSIMFRVRGKLLLPASLGGLFTWSIYLFLFHRLGARCLCAAKADVVLPIPVEWGAE